MISAEQAQEKLALVLQEAEKTTQRWVVSQLAELEKQIDTAINHGRYECCACITVIPLEKFFVESSEVQMQKLVSELRKLKYSVDYRSYSNASKSTYSISISWSLSKETKVTR